jgi:hypothetical protein
MISSRTGGGGEVCSSISGSKHSCMHPQAGTALRSPPPTHTHTCVGEPDAIL